MEPKKICKNLINFYYMIFFDIFHNKTKHEKIIFLNIFFLSLVLFGFQMEPKIVFGSQKVTRKKMLK